MKCCLLLVRPRFFPVIFFFTATTTESISNCVLCGNQVLLSSVPQLVRHWRPSFSSSLRITVRATSTRHFWSCSFAVGVQFFHVCKDIFEVFLFLFLYLLSTFGSRRCGEDRTKNAIQITRQVVHRWWFWIGLQCFSKKSSPQKTMIEQSRGVNKARAMHFYAS